jgi:putative transposase
MSEIEIVPELSGVAEACWLEARHRLTVIQELARHGSRTTKDVQTAAKQLNCSVPLVYRLLRRYLQDPRLTSLLPRARGRRRGVSQCPLDVDRLIHEVIDAVYLSRQRARLSDVELEVRRRCHELALPAPSRKAITARVRQRPRQEVVSRREGARKARALFTPVLGHLEAEWPLSIVQIDHTLVDVIVVDSATRKPIQRPWLTLAIDVYSRCVAGFYLSLEPPSATSVALCVAHAALPKVAWLAERHIEADWPVHGIFSRLHLDNAKEFRSEALRRGCEQYGITIDYRPVRTPHYGGHIERLIGTMMGKVHLLPGTTFSNIEERGDTDPEKTAAMTIDEVERWLGLAIAGAYHANPHRALDMTPLAAWTRGVGGDGTTAGHGAPPEVIDRRRFLIDFLPIERRLVRREGVSLHSIHYWSDVLTTWVGDPDRMIVRYDPRDLSRIYLLAPSGEYFDLSYRDVRRPPITLWEQRLALKRLREQRDAHIDEGAIFRAVEEMRAIAEQAMLTTKAARRQQERRLRLVQGGRQDPLDSSPPATETAVMTDEERNKRQPWEKMLPVEEWE